MPPGTPDEVQPPAEPLSHAQHLPTHPAATLPAISSTVIRWRSAVPAALMAGVLAGLGTIVPFLPFVLLCMLAAGGLSVTFYTRRVPHEHLRSGMGLRIGALAGLFGFLMNAGLSSLGMLSAANRATLRTEMANRLKEAIAASSDPAATETLRNLGDKLNTSGGLLLFFGLALAFFGILFIILSGIGGAIGAALFGRKEA